MVCAFWLAASRLAVGVASFRYRPRARPVPEARAQAPVGKCEVSPRIRPGRRAWPAEPLTGREIEVLQLLRGSLQLREIAAELGVSPNTVKTQTQAIYRKLGASSRRDAISRGHQAGILRPRGGQLYALSG